MGSLSTCVANITIETEHARDGTSHQRPPALATDVLEAKLQQLALVSPTGVASPAALGAEEEG